MAKRKQVVDEEVQSIPAEQGGPETTVAVEEPGESEQPARQWRPNPFPIKTVDLDGYKVRLQESRATGSAWQMQIKFGDGSKDDMPSDTVRDFIRSFRLKVKTSSGEEKEVQMFHWNDLDRAWGMGIDYEAPATSRAEAERVFKETVELVAKERGAGRER